MLLKVKIYQYEDCFDNICSQGNLSCWKTCSDMNAWIDDNYSTFTLKYVILLIWFIFIYGLSL